MSYAFVVPIVYGFAAILLYRFVDEKVYCLSILSMITLFFYFILRGILEIYGTTNRLINIHLYSSVFLVIICLLIIIINLIILFKEYYEGR